MLERHGAGDGTEAAVVEACTAAAAAREEALRALAHALGIKRRWASGMLVSDDGALHVWPGGPPAGVRAETACGRPLADGTRDGRWSVPARGAWLALPAGVAHCPDCRPAAAGQEDCAESPAYPPLPGPLAARVASEHHRLATRAVQRDALDPAAAAAATLASALVPALADWVAENADHVAARVLARAGEVDPADVALLGPGEWEGWVTSSARVVLEEDGAGADVRARELLVAAVRWRAESRDRREKPRERPATGPVPTSETAPAPR